ncbi:MAG: DUF3336 domain-containing protein [Gammaproteobacteria bacterium]
MRLINATTYDEWKSAAMAQDERMGGAKWRKKDETTLYDWQVIRRRIDEVRTVRASGDPHRLLFYLNEGIHGNMGGMGNPALYNRSRFGTKDLVTDYIGELAGALEQVAASDEIEFYEKLEFFRRASHCFGRSALMLSGAGALGPFHFGVVKALLEQGLLPDVVSGASAGSMVAALVGTHDDETLLSLFDPKTLADAFGAYSGDPNRAVGSRMSIEHVREAVAGLIPDLTFEEAFEKTGRKINISVSPRELHQRSRLLNAITSRVHDGRYAGATPDPVVWCQPFHQQSDQSCGALDPRRSASERRSVHPLVVHLSERGEGALQSQLPVCHGIGRQDLPVERDDPVDLRDRHPGLYRRREHHSAAPVLGSAQAVIDSVRAGNPLPDLGRGGGHLAEGRDDPELHADQPDSGYDSGTHGANRRTRRAASAGTGTVATSRPSGALSALRRADAI